MTPTTGAVPANELAPMSAQSTYLVRLATTDDEIQQALALRYDVFNIEMGEGLPSSDHTHLDKDKFDDVCQHMNVIERSSGLVVGTYRLQTGPSALRNHGYYSDTEFGLQLWEKLRPEIIELGRACVAKEHRNTMVLGILWSGLADFATRNRMRYLVGCSSVHGIDPVLGATIYRHLQKSGREVGPELAISPRPHGSCSLETVLPELPKDAIPKLFALYLTVGAKICGPPFIDTEFKTTDYLTFMDMQKVPESVANRFFRKARLE